MSQESITAPAQAGHESPEPLAPAAGPTSEPEPSGQQLPMSEPVRRRSIVPVVAGVLTLAVAIGVAAWAFLAGPLRPTIELPRLTDLTVTDAVAALEPLKLTVIVKDDLVDPVGEEADLWLVSDNQQPDPLHADDTVTLTVRTILQDAADACGAGQAEDGGRSLFLDMEGEDLGSGTLAYADVQCVLEELETPASTLNAMGQTRALDGRQSDEWNGLEASWSYHPDDGLDVIVKFA